MLSIFLRRLRGFFTKTKWKQGDLIKGWEVLEALKDGCTISKGEEGNYGYREYGMVATASIYEKTDLGWTNTKYHLSFSHILNNEFTIKSTSFWMR
jgi:hypothetical protein